MIKIVPNIKYLENWSNSCFCFGGVGNKTIITLPSRTVLYREKRYMENGKNIKGKRKLNGEVEDL